MYNTVIAYYFGILFYDFEKPVINTLKDAKVYWCAAVISVLLITLGLYYHNNFVLFELCITAGCLFLILFCMKIEMNSPVFIHLNKYSLEIYLVQRIPMLVFQEKLQPNILYFAVCAVITYLLALVWKWIYERISLR